MVTCQMSIVLAQDYMKIVIGLGNPGKQYSNTRHNMGFMVLDTLANELNLDWKNDADRKALIAKDKDLLLAKPQTFMNASGDAARALVSYYKIDVSDLLMVYDDIDLMLGETRQKDEGSSGGHNGMQSVIDVLGTREIKRLRVGIAEEQAGRQDIPSESYVLQPFSGAVKKKVEAAIEQAAAEAKTWIL